MSATRKWFVETYWNKEMKLFYSIFIFLRLADSLTTIFILSYCPGGTELNPITREYHENYGLIEGQAKNVIFYDLPNFVVDVLLPLGILKFVFETTQAFTKIRLGVLWKPLLKIAILYYSLYSLYHMSGNFEYTIACLRVLRS